jgi:Xaa-Pro aminopeptidase
MFTIEPGIYIPEISLGVRIEDDILVTADGHEVLTASAPKDAVVFPGRASNATVWIVI